MENFMVTQIVSKLIESNVFVVEHKNTCIIIDAGAELEFVKKAVEGKRVVGIFLTHGHYDHCFYATTYQKEFGCPIFCSEKAKEYLENPNFNYSEGKLKITDFSNFKFLQNEGTLHLQNFDVSYKQLGGHSLSDMCYFVDEDVFVGDILIGRDMGRIDLYGGSKIEMKKSLQFLKEQTYQKMHAGHGADFDKTTQDKVISLWLKFLSR